MARGMLRSAALILIALASALSQQDEPLPDNLPSDIDDLLNSVFTKAPPKQAEPVLPSRGGGGDQGQQNQGNQQGQNSGTFPGNQQGQNGGNFPGNQQGQNGGTFPGNQQGQNGGTFPGNQQGQNGGTFPGNQQGQETGQQGNAQPSKPRPQQPNLNPTDSDSKDKSCTTDDGQIGRCVQYYLCGSNNSIITNGEGIIDIRVRNGPCESYLEVCCLPPDTVKIPITPPPPTVKRPTGCGYRNPSGVLGFKIKGDVDSEAHFGEFNWMVAVLREEAVEGSPQKLNVYQGGGSLIHPRVVLTAAHTFAGMLDQNPNLKLKVRVGEWDTQTKDEILPHQDREVVKIVKHPDYVKDILFNDFGLLFLASEVEPAENVGTICLPTQNEFIRGGTRCFASGWGKDVFGKEGRYQVILKKVELPFIEHDDCENRLHLTRLGEYFRLDRSFICAGGEPGKDTCKGDGGSPLVCAIPGTDERYVQAGIVAWGIGCGEKLIPGVYASVAGARNWIDNVIVGEGLSIDSYGSY